MESPASGPARTETDYGLKVLHKAFPRNSENRKQFGCSHSKAGLAAAVLSKSML